MANSNSFTHHLLFFSTEATSETYGPRIFFLIYLLAIYFYFAFLFRYIKPKIQKYLAAFYLYLFYLAFDLSIYYNLSHVRLPISGAVTRKGLTTPLTRRVARCCYLCADVVYVVLLGSPTGSIPWFHHRGKHSIVTVLHHPSLSEEIPT